ncbi:unnamed protein product [Spirodela intermedia]|uniref:U-box domain-containing protein n=1 Tax=Spirodela intermedia TaxID=51605 RepID=A0A7I8JEA9_SPIIN|nr:unnamed protein product [Spirodela intermedia]CAA6668466.1 unnamed protein product [Spirodela intermedia]
MEEIEVPCCFVCPISLQIMKDPVTTTTGATYDRQSIERWLLVDRRRTCPATNQPLPAPSELTTNHTLRRLIHAWLATGESHRRRLVESLAAAIIESSRENQADMAEQALSILLSLVAEPEELKPLVECNNHELVHSLAWFLCSRVTTQAIIAMSIVFELGGRSCVERLKPEFFPPVVGFLRARRSPSEMKAALKVLLAAGECGANRGMMVDAGAIGELVELELAAPSCRRTTELVLAVLAKLCMCAEGRAELLRHPAAIAVVGKTLLRVSRRRTTRR